MASMLFIIERILKILDKVSGFFKVSKAEKIVEIENETAKEKKEVEAGGRPKWEE